VVVRAYLVTTTKDLEFRRVSTSSEDNSGRFIVSTRSVLPRTLWDAMTRGGYLLKTVEAKGDDPSGIDCGGYPPLQVVFVDEFAGLAGDVPSCDWKSDRLWSFHTPASKWAEAEFRVRR
jgi:hypothetical protein